MSLDKIGQDEWVAQAEARRARRGPFGRVLARLEMVNPFVLGGVVFALAALVPLLTSNAYVIRIAGNTCLFGLVALGLNTIPLFPHLTHRSACDRLAIRRCCDDSYRYSPIRTLCCGSRW
jgi:hypothetical protein